REMADAQMNMLEIDDRGLDEFDRKFLRTIISNYDGGPVGVETLSSALGEERDTIEDMVEPYLLQLGFLNRTPRGRFATRLACEHLGLTYKGPKEDNGQGRLL
ncbi:MAG: Holliday junction DNA helicase RuvB C-terminal domain-containing protein, partial [Chthonomonadales bacterium]